MTENMTVPESEQDAAGNSSEIRIKDKDMKDIELTESRTKSNEDIVEVSEKKGLMRSAIPHVNVPVAWMVLFFNVFLPGIGTLLLSLFALCGVQTDLKQSNRCLAFLINFGTGLLQTITALVIIGWIWSVYWGMHAVTQANEEADERKKKLRAKNAANENAV